MPNIYIIDCCKIIEQDRFFFKKMPYFYTTFFVFWSS